MTLQEWIDTRDGRWDGREECDPSGDVLFRVDPKGHPTEDEIGDTFLLRFAISDYVYDLSDEDIDKGIIRMVPKEGRVI